MHQLFYETRNLPARPSATLAADIARHLQTRQYVGTTLIVCENPNAMLSAVRKQWLKATRSLQRLRASTLNAEEILRLTHATMHMHNLLFSSKNPADHPEASAFFMTPGQFASLPPQCANVYLTMPITKNDCKNLFKKLPPNTLIITYAFPFEFSEFGLKPKTELEQKVFVEWEKLTTFLHRHNIDPANLVVGGVLQFEAMDDALDTLLGVSSEFLREAAAFQYAVNISQPLIDIPKMQQKKFEAVTRLAHRVQALTPGNFNNFLTTMFNDSGSQAFFLRDVGSELYADLEMAANARLSGL